ncbi:MAG: secretin N-terminal domain-containing protein [Candidatus Omnitrophica bacterium]|nr:secretin N-terminal domain-containing protein [Candidatus Omnitrophota bacterium]
MRRFILAAIVLSISAFGIIPVLAVDSEGDDTVAPETQASQEPGLEIVSTPGEGGSEMISLDLKGVDIVELLRIFSLKMKRTIVPSKGVSGRINVFLNNLTLEDAFDVILVSQDLACEKNGSVINVMTAGEYESLYGKKYNEKRKVLTIKLKYARPATIFNALSQTKSDIGKIVADEASGTIIVIDTPDNLEMMDKMVKDLDKPVETEIFDIRYAKPADVKAHLSGAITSGPGEVYSDDRSGKIIVSDLPDKMKKIEHMVKALDEESQQVFIEAEILQITLKDEYQRGIDWEKVFSNRNVDGLDFVGEFPSSPSFTPTTELSSTDLLKMTIGTVAADKYSFTVQLLQTFGDTKILSRPRITALNNQEAKIMVGSREAYISQTLSQADTTTVTSESVQFIDVGVKLNVVPSINRDGFVTLKIKPEVSSVRETITTSLGSTVPIVETSEAETTVKVRDGTMIMIAGLMKEDRRDDVTTVPLFSRIPFLGLLFQSKAKRNIKTEMVVFLTPHISRGDANVYSTEPEKIFPPDILPDDLKDKVVAKKVSEIGPESSQSPSEKAKQKMEEDIMPKPSEEEFINIQEKMKGIKKY